MKKRIACFIMTLIMLVSLVPTAAISASAASYTVSEAAITVLKKMTTLKTTCYRVGGDSSEFRIGYGTVCSVGMHKVTRNGGEVTVKYLDPKGKEIKDRNGDVINEHRITEKQADAMLRESLAELDKKVDSFASSNKVTLSQSQHDALVVFSYGVGTAWMSGTNAVKTAIVSRARSTDLLNAMVSVYGKGSEARRKVEVNMYCNGIYSNVVPSSYTQVKYDPNGGTVAGLGDGETYVMYMDSATTVGHPVIPTKYGCKFMGWYLEENGVDKYMPKLTAECKGKTLVAHWQENGTNASNATDEGTVVSYTVEKSKLASTTVYNTPDKKDPQKILNSKGKLVTLTMSNHARYKDKSETKIYICREYIDSKGVKWGLMEDDTYDVNQWVIISGKVTVTLEASADAIAKATVRYSGGSVRVRSGAGTGFPIVGSVYDGQTLDILEMKTVNGHKWGRITAGWFCLTYANVTMLGSNTDVDVSSEGALAYTYSARIVSNDFGGPYTNPTTNSNTIDGKYLDRDDFDNLKPGTPVTVTNMTLDSNGNLWVKISWKAKYKEVVDKKKNKTETRETTGYGWVQVADASNEEYSALSISSTPVQIGPVTYTVAANEITVRESPSSGGSPVFRMNRGVQFEVQKICLIGEDIWGKTQEQEIVNSKYDDENNGDYQDDDYTDGGLYVTGWVNLSSKYVSRTSLPTVEGGSDRLSPIGKTATIVNTDSVRVRVTSALYGRQVGTLPRGTTANILQIEDGWYNLDIDVDDDPETGSWVYEDYVQVNDGYVASNGSNTTTVNNPDGTKTTTTTVGKGVVANTYSGVNFRSGAGIGYAFLGKLLPGTAVDILETKNAGAAKWGRVNYNGKEGWVCMDYITMISSTTTTTTTTTGNGTAVKDLGTIAKTTTTAVYTGNIIDNTDVAVLRAEDVQAGEEGKYVWATPKHNQDCDYAIRKLKPGEAITIYELLEVTEAVWIDNATGDIIDTDAEDDFDIQEEGGHGESEDSYSKETIVSYWARTSDGYIYNPQDCIELYPLDEKVHTLTGSDTLNVRNEANGSEVYGQLEKGDQVVVTNVQIINDKVWGEIEYGGDDDNNGIGTGWVRLDYMSEGAYYEEKVTNTQTNTTNNGGTVGTNGNVGNTGNTGGLATNAGGYRYTGKVINVSDANPLKVRNSASTSAGIATTLKNGASLVIYETTISENMAWGRCDAGWVYLYYVDLTPATAGVVDARVVYNDNTIIYSDSNGSSTVGTYARMSVIDIYEIVGKMARTDQGWVNTDNLL